MVLFQDGFSNNSKNWELPTSKSVSCVFSNGLAITNTLKTKSQKVFNSCDLAGKASWQLHVNFQLSDVTTFFSIVWNQEPPQNRCELRIDADKQLTIGSTRNKQWKAIDQPLSNSSLHQSPDAFNQLTITCKNGREFFAINGMHLHDTMQLANKYSGTFGFIIGARSSVVIRNISLVSFAEEDKKFDLPSYSFKEFFEDNRNKWLEQTNESENHSYSKVLADKKCYRIESEKGYFTSRKRALPLPSEPYRIDTHFAMPGLSENGYAGLIWGVTNTTDHFFHISNNNQTFSVSQRIRGEETSWVDWKRWTKSTAILVDNEATNKLSIIIEKDTSYFYINDQLVYQHAMEAVYNSFGFSTHNEQTMEVHQLTAQTLRPYRVKSTKMVLEECQKLIGLDNIKNSFQQISQAVDAQRTRREQGLREPALTYHTAFIGPSGTGKTTIARLLSQLLQSKNITKNNKIVEATRVDLVAEHTGQTAPKVLKKIEEASGGILLINNADSLLKPSEYDFGKEALETLQSYFSADPDCILFLVGRFKPMDMLFKQYPDLLDILQQTFEFDHYDHEELYDIFIKYCEETDFQLEKTAVDQVRHNLLATSFAAGDHFRNAHDVRSFYEVVVQNHSRRIAVQNSISKDTLQRITRDDIPYRPLTASNKRIASKQPAFELSRNAKSPLDSMSLIQEELHKLVGLDLLKKEIASLINFAVVQQQRQMANKTSNPFTYHMVFKGPPGTGKTTVARLLGEVFYNLGILSKGHVIETDRSGLVAAYTGQTALKVEERFQEAIGGILFIDEAYALAPLWHDNFGIEAINTLVKLMEDNRGNCIVIVAGYDEPMDHFLESNVGLASRFSRYFDFPSYKPFELLAIFDKLAKEATYSLTPAAKRNAATHFANAAREGGESFGNGRYARKLFEKACERQANRLVKKQTFGQQALSTIQGVDIPPETIQEGQPYDNELFDRLYH